MDLATDEEECYGDGNRDDGVAGESDRREVPNIVEAEVLHECHSRMKMTVALSLS
jgi:hypothetical protein